MPSRDELRRLLEAVRSACGRDLPTVTMAEVELMTPREKMSVYRELVHDRLRVVGLPECPLTPIDPAEVARMTPAEKVRRYRELVRRT